ncbi:YheC/YheD family protein [Neobacillus sp. PS3-40]|uniref:YheC/YheD family protein n=1 Tax=Neobacillus sp. PS3-40 TaxID=3070679 RepID=UPI0027E08590|nr:YheC/YheD family protein [Neobacillus sp. PS3-40]WML43446.1 YheC/YheD family protein [Neobacillus sp. PS3-40]
MDGKERVFNYLNEVKTEQSYILQNMDFLNNLDDGKIFEVFVTLQREAPSKWHVAAVLEKTCLAKMKQIPKILHEVAIMAALSLEEFLPKCPTIVLDIGFMKNKLWIRDIDLHFSKSKWSQFQIFTSSKEISNYVPYTQLATPCIFSELIKKNKQVFLKPCFGQWGIGILQVSLLKEDLYEVHNERKKVTFQSSKEVIDYLQAHYLSENRYILQERVSLATIDDCPFDVRVMVQRNSYEPKWEITGKIAKIASKDFVVTNVAKSLLPIEEALQKAKIKTISKNYILFTIDKICIKAAELIGKNFIDEKTIGFDIGIDHKGKVWIIEANLRPDSSMFHRLEDKTMYEKIISKKKRK